MTLLNSYFEVKQFSSKKIQQEYQAIIEKLLIKFGENLEKLGESDLEKFLKGPFTKYQINGEDKYYAPTTYEKNVNILKSFLNTIFEEGLLDKNYAESIEALDNNREIKFDQLPSAKEIIAIQKQLYTDEIKTNYYALRDLVIFNLIFHSGLSPKELASMSIGDTGFQGTDYIIHVEKPKLRNISISIQDAKYLSHLLKLRESIGPRDNAIFVSQKRKTRLADRTFRHLISELCKTVKIDGESIPVYSAEKFRNAGIVAALSFNYSMDDMREQMQVSPKYFNTRFKYIDKERTKKSYAELFEPFKE